METTPVRSRPVVAAEIAEPADAARSDLLSWSSIVAGVLAAFALFVLFAAIGVGSGLEAAQPKFGREVGLIITGLLGVLAFLAGGFIAVWTADVEDMESAIMHGFLVWALFVVLLLTMVSLGASSALGSAAGVFTASVASLTPDEIKSAGWGSVFALAIAMSSSILGAILATRHEVRSRWPFAR